MSSKTISPEKYILAFGKYKNMRAVDVAQISVVDKAGNDKPTGLLYLEWLCEQEWFKHKDIVFEVIKKAQGSTSEVDESKKKKDAKQKKGTVSVSTNETLELNK